MTAPTIELPPLAAPVDELWHVLLDLGEQLTVGWALVGGQMVLCTPSSTGGCLRRSARTGLVAASRTACLSSVRYVVATVLEAAGRSTSRASSLMRHRTRYPAAGRAEACLVDVLGPEGLPAGEDSPPAPW